MGNNPYEKKTDTEEESFTQSSEEREVEIEKNPYANGTYSYSKNGENVDVQKGKNPYETKGEDISSKTTEKPAKKQKRTGKIILSVVLAILLFLSGGVASWFLLDSQTRSFLKVKFLIDNFYYEDIDDEDFYDVVFDAINYNLLDAYSQYYTADEFEAVQSQATGARSGLGLSFAVNAQAGDELKIVRVSGNSPAEAAGLKVGMRITAIGKEETQLQECKTFDEFALLLGEYETGEPFYIKLLDGQTEKTVAVSKQAFVENYVFYRSNDSAYRFTGAHATLLTEGGDPLTALGEDTAYILLTEFNGSAVEEFDKAMSVFRKEGKKNLVLDLRGNGGGDLNILCDIAKYFCKNSNAKKPVVAIGAYQNYEEKFKASDNVYYDYFSKESRICVLADSGTASASEALIGCMSDYGALSYADICLSERGNVAKTYGKGIMQMTIPLLFGKDALKITVAKILWPVSGNCIHGRGILPQDGVCTVKENSDDDEEIADALAKLFKSGSVSGGGTPVKTH